MTTRVKASTASAGFGASLQMKIASHIFRYVAAWLIPKHGQRPRPVARIFLRTSGAPRKWLGVRWQARIRQRILVDWLTDVHGIEVSNDFVATEHLPQSGVEVYPDALIISNAVSGIILMMESGASIVAGGQARIAECLASSETAVVAYADALFADEKGRVADHWLKAPRTDPLLVASGLLLHGLVAVREDAPGAHALLDTLRNGASLQQALAEFGSRLPGRAFVHCDTPVVLCRPPKPLPVDPPPLPDSLPTASILIPTRDGWDILSACLTSLRETDWPSNRLEVVVIDNGSEDPETCRELDALSKRGEITLLKEVGEFNFARLNNVAAKVARGDLLVLLNNDTVARDGGWLKRLAAYALQREIGAVGCKLLYPEGDVQHAGVVCGIRGGAQHVFVSVGENAPGYNHLAVVDRSVSAVTAACLAVTRAAFDSVGGMREDFAVSYNDVVFCLDLMEMGYRNVSVAKPLFFHHESRSRGKDINSSKRELYRRECADTIRIYPETFVQDPFYSGHLSRKVDNELLPS